MFLYRMWNLKHFIVILVKKKFEFILMKLMKFVRQIRWTAEIRRKVICIHIILIILLIGGNTVTVSKADVNFNNSSARKYCRATSCSVIDCEYVPTSLDAGEVASKFIATNFKLQCPDSTFIPVINFHNCNFCGNKLGPHWLRSSLPIVQICFRDTYLSEISDDAFAQSIFFDLRSLLIIDSNVSTLKRTIFRRMSNLRTFLVHDNLVRHAESNLLQYVAGTLEVLELDRSINNIEVLNNITGKGSLLNVQILSIQGNSFHALTSETFLGVANVQSLYIDKSEVTSMSVDALRPIQSLYQLFLRNNKLTTLPQGILNPILNKGDSRFRLAIGNNPWHCNCSLTWLKQLMTTYPSMVIDKPTCDSPKNVAYQPIDKAELCDPHQKTTTTTDNPKTTSSELPSKPEDTISVSCEIWYPALKHYHITRKLLSSDYQFRRKIPNFSVQELNNGSILVNLVNLYEKSLTILWFDNTELQSSEKESNVIHCVKNVYSSLILNNIREGVTYTICILESFDQTPSPLNCLALATDPDYQSRSWISNGDRSIIIGIVSLTLISLCICSGLATFFIVRRHPSLLRGSKRVIIVRRREINTVILPEGIQTSPCHSPDTLRSEEVSYITPLGGFDAKRKNSQMSRSSHSSDASYISGIEPNLLQLISWRTSRTNNEVPPPLPPYSPRIPSVSQMLDSKANEFNFDPDVGDTAKL